MCTLCQGHFGLNQKDRILLRAQGFAVFLGRLCCQSRDAPPIKLIMPRVLRLWRFCVFVLKVFMDTVPISALLVRWGQAFCPMHGTSPGRRSLSNPIPPQGLALSAPGQIIGSPGRYMALLATRQSLSSFDRGTTVPLSKRHQGWLQATVSMVQFVP